MALTVGVISMHPMTKDFFRAVYRIAYGRLSSAEAASETTAGTYQDLDGVVAIMFDILAVQEYTEDGLLSFFGNVGIGKKAQDFMKDLGIIYDDLAPHYVEHDALTRDEWNSVVAKARELYDWYEQHGPPED